MRRGSRSDRSPVVTRKFRGFRDPTACERCGAVFTHKAWHGGAGVEPELLMRAAWDVCPACRQVARGEAFGVVMIRGVAPEGAEAFLRRVENVAARAEFNQPERRIVEIRRRGDDLEVRTTSQKLAHRIACELAKAFGGHTRFEWSHGDGRLFATWEPRARA